MTETYDASPNPHGVPGGLDPRPGLMSAIALAGGALAAVRPEQLRDPTPCPDYNVRTLGKHLISVLRRVSVVGRGGDPFSVPTIATDVSDSDWAIHWAAAEEAALAALADPDVLGRTVRMPFGQMPGAIAAGVYATEITLHTWDLATATGQHPSWDPAVLTAAIATMHRVPPEPRGGSVPFGPVVKVAADAPEIDKLVAWYGRQPRGRIELNLGDGAHHHRPRSYPRAQQQQAETMTRRPGCGSGSNGSRPRTTPVRAITARMASRVPATPRTRSALGADFGVD